MATDGPPPPRLTSAMLVSAMVRRVQAAGGFATIIHRGDGQSGAIIVDCTQRGERELRLERATGRDGRDGWRIVENATREGAGTDESPPHPFAPQPADDRLARRLRSDPDLWVVELDIAQAERFAAEVIGMA
ncbi:MAG: DUF1491 family protein [Sphingopyxis sp.]